MPASFQRARFCPCGWPFSWRAINKPSIPTGPFLCLLHPKFRNFLKKLCQFAVLGFLIIILVLWLGMAYEQAQVRKLPSTEYLYTTPKVCAISYNESLVEALTYPNASMVEHVIAKEQTDGDNETSTLIAHCGDCGKCSTPHDIVIYDETRNTLFQESIACAKHGLIGGYRGASRCMAERVGLSDGCNQCWVENIMCDLRLCIFTCFLRAIFSNGVHGGSGQEELNRCTKCDEIRCGPAFLKCAGANRRRTAIQSDIERDAKVEVCHDVHDKWWLNQELQAVWQKEDGKNATVITRKRKREKKRHKGILNRLRAKGNAKRNETRF